MRILLVEDEAELLHDIAKGLTLKGYAVDGADKCTSCGACGKACRMDVDVFRTPNHAECIRCGDCVRTCPHQAIRGTFSLKSTDREKGKTI